MKITTILDILKSYGASDSMIENCKKNEMPKLIQATMGKSVSFCVKQHELGRCYRAYDVVVVNYKGSVNEWPTGMCGPVAPKGSQVHDGVNVAHFYYDIDSGD
jgi:hypothetical protein